MRRRFATLDVFTERRFAGNPLAVVLDAENLETEAMQAIAREFNHPETVFVLAAADPAHRAALRIFTPALELPFAAIRRSAPPHCSAASMAAPNARSWSRSASVLSAAARP
jgi:PhzF family phenazine biosynthesis protein